VRITRADGLISVRQAAALCGVEEVTVRNWITRGYWLRDHSRKCRRGCGHRCTLQVAKREDGLIWLDPVEVAKAEYHTARKAGRVTDLVPA
jgi:phage antirepressor YoqD-like protein